MIVPLLDACLIAWQTAGSAPPIETKHLTVQLSTGPIAAGKLPLYVDITPQPAMHVYAPGQPGYIAIELKIDAGAPVIVAGKPKYPAGEKVVMPALNETQLVYSKPFRVTQDVTLPKGARGPITIKGTLRYQACDDTICYKPNSLALTWTLANP
jgi:hypothetical protein